MNLFMLNLFLALGFSAVRGQFTLTGLLAGFAVGYLALWISKPLYPDAAYFARVPRVLHLGAYFVYQLVVSNFRVMWEVITPRQNSRPGIIGIELAAMFIVQFVDGLERSHTPAIRPGARQGVEGVGNADDTRNP